MTPYQQGLTHYQAGDYQAGLVNFTEAIRLDLKPIDAAYYERSKCYEALGQIDAAKADLAHMLTLSIDEARRKQIKLEIETLMMTDALPLKVSWDCNIGAFRHTNLILVGLALLALYLCNISLGWYNETRELELSPQTTKAQVIKKSTGQRGKSGQITYYMIDYQYIASLPNGEPHTYQGESEVSLLMYNQTESTITIIYASHDPAISRVAASFSPSYEYRNTRCFVLVMIIIFVLMLMNVQAMKYSQQLLDNGRTTPGTISKKETQITKNKQNKEIQTYVIYYRYYGYEGWFFALVNDQFNVGDTIKVAYLPDKPYISKPYYETFPFPEPPSSQEGCMVFIGLAVAGVMASTLFSVAIFSVMRVFTDINQPDLYGSVLCLSPLIAIIIPTLIGKRIGRVGGSRGELSGFLAGFMGYILFGWCTVGYLLDVIKSLLSP